MPRENTKSIGRDRFVAFGNVKKPDTLKLAELDVLSCSIIVPDFKTICVDLLNDSVVNLPFDCWVKPPSDSGNSCQLVHKFIDFICGIFKMKVPIKISVKINSKILEVRLKFDRVTG
ncbi:hypothetical protein CDAR_276561 [Caerostris darwini]|uniref:LAGLIDADG homing endonuclease n=1 Tax=Caerostris darwini TaxID=1538125 RepID=A0AAV4MZC5_9ARAC|nr:hypothetical protein CDAR_276561 [Caerostris darwini]